MKDEDWEQLLRQSLAPDAEPDEKLNQNIIHHIKENSRMKRKTTSRWSIGLLAAVMLLLLSVSAYAASKLLSPQQVAEQTGHQLVADAFGSQDAIEINQTKTSGEYTFTLHGLVSGAGLTEFESSQGIHPDRTYAVVSIGRLDGKPMPHTSDSDYGEDPFFVSPIIKGVKPWLVNIVTMNGAYSDMVVDGVMYRIIECDQVEMFADRGLYLAISSGSQFYNTEAFAYDEAAGTLQPREDFPGVSLLFDLLLDPAKANSEEAAVYLEGLLHPTSSEQSGNTGEEEWVTWMNHVRAQIRDGQSVGEIIPDSLREVTYDDNGNFNYRFGERNVTRPVEEYFRDGQVGFSNRLSISGTDDRLEVLVFYRDENGVMTGKVIVLDEVYLSQTITAEQVASND